MSIRIEGPFATLTDKTGTHIVGGKVVNLRPGICKPCYDGEHKNCYGDGQYNSCVCECRKPQPDR